MSTPAAAIPDPLVLAAIDRARIHRADGETAVPIWAITEHLGIPRRSRIVRAQIAALEASGAIERSRRHGIAMWSLTSAGKRRLTRARRAGEIELPESPQHAKWRNTRTLAEQEIERCHQAARDAIEAATAMLDAPVSDGPSSDEWFEIAQRLQRACWHLGSATYCLREWPEPSDAAPDIDERLEPHERTLDIFERTQLRAKRQGRRGFTSWIEEEHSRYLIAFGRTIRQLRAEQNISADELANLAGLTPARLDAIEAGRYDPRYDVLLALATGLRVTPAALINRVGDQATDGAA